MNVLSDSEIILMVRQGRREVFRVMVERYWSKVRNILRRALNDQETVEDLCQETFLKAYEKIDQFDVSRNFGPWLFKIGVNLVGEHFRKAGNKLRCVALEETDLSSFLSGPGEQVADRMLVDEYLDKLPVFLRLIFVLKHGLMLSYEEISQILDEPIGSVKGNLNRARGCLKAHYSRTQAQEQPAREVKTT